MTYKEIIKAISQQKGSHQNEKSCVVDFERFSILKTDKMPEILLDNDVAHLISDRRWCIDSHGYAVASINGELVRLHDVVMAYKYGEKPASNYVDHINQDKLDNRAINLRFVTPLESSKNIPLKGNNTSGHTGVSKTKYGTYRAYITVNKNWIGLGQYKTYEEAVNARREAEERFGFKARPEKIKDLCEMEKEKT